MAKASDAKSPVYVMQGDPSIFQHIIDFAQHERFPLFYEISNGFDVARYLQLHRMADSLGVTKLSLWLKAKRYAYAIEPRWSATGVRVPDDEDFEAFIEDLMTDATSEARVHFCSKGSSAFALRFDFYHDLCEDHLDPSSWRKQDLEELASAFEALKAE